MLNYYEYNTGTNNVLEFLEKVVLESISRELTGIH